jgi:DNA-binding IclR family transcriptional regulator
MVQPQRGATPQPVAERIAAIVLAIADRPKTSMAEVARKVGLAASTTHRLLTALVTGRLVERSRRGRYDVTLGGTPRSGAAVLREHVSCTIADLAVITGLNARFEYGTPMECLI